MVVGIDDLLGRGGAMLMWPVLKRVLPKDDQVTRDFWHAKLATVNPHYLKGVGRSLVAEPYPLHTRLRDLAQFLPIRFPGVASGFLVSTFAGCSRLLRDPSFGPPTGAHLDALRPGWQQSAFTGAHRREMEHAADALLDDLDGRGPAVDLVEGPALPFASLSLGRLLGIADDESIRLGRLTRQVSGAFDQFATAGQHARAAAAGAELARSCCSAIRTRRPGCAGGPSWRRERWPRSFATSRRCSW